MNSTTNPPRLRPVIVDARVDGAFSEYEGGRWVTYCRQHGEFVQHETRRLARAFVEVPAEWCEACAAADAGGYALAVPTARHRARTATCPECSRVFNLADHVDAAEWHAGHDCEPTGEPDIRIPSARHLRDELEAIASVELRDVLDAWPVLTVAQSDRLAAYLRDELAPCGMLSVEKAREAGHTIGRERQDARRVLRAVDDACAVIAAGGGAA